MDAPGEWRCPVAEVPPGRSATFRICCGAHLLSGFLVNYGGEFHAYVNSCAHAGTPLDTWPNEFFSEDGRHLVCSTHGAVYAPDSGISAPCTSTTTTRPPSRLRTA